MRPYPILKSVGSTTNTVRKVSSARLKAKMQAANSSTQTTSSSSSSVGVASVARVEAASSISSSISEEVEGAASSNNPLRTCS